MTICATELPADFDVERLKQKILTLGLGEIEVWKKSVIADRRLFNRLFDCIFLDDPRLAWRSCWIIDTASEDFPELLDSKLPLIINGLLTTRNSSLKRHFTRILCRYPLPEEYLARLVDRSFELLSPAEPAAVRVYAMQLLFNITKELPDLKGELIVVIESMMEETGTAGFFNRAQKLLKQLHHL